MVFKIFMLLCVLFTSSNAVAISDPTKPLTGGNHSFIDPQKVELVLKSIIHGNGIHTVIINNQLMKVGDAIGEYKLIAVNDNSVILRSNEERKKLFLFSNAIAK